VAKPAAALSDRLVTQRADLAVIDVPTGRAERVVSDALVFSYAFSPDDGSIVYSMLTGAHPTTQQGLFNLRVVSLDTRADSVVASSLALATGNTWSSSPDGRWIAYGTADNDDPAGDVVLSGTLEIISLNGGGRPIIAAMPPGTGREVRAVPVWSRDGSELYRVANGEVWSVALRTGIGRRVAQLDGARVRSIATPSGGRAVSAALDTADALFVIAGDSTGARSGLYSIEPSSGLARPRIVDERWYAAGLSLAVSPSNGPSFS
jgi:hypothetical protein